MREGREGVREGGYQEGVQEEGRARGRDSAWRVGHATGMAKTAVSR